MKKNLNILFLAAFIFFATIAKSQEASSFYDESNQTNTVTNHLVNKDLFTVYPNPTKGDFTITFDDMGNYNIELYDVLGNIVYTEEIENKSQFSVHLKKSLSKGYYMLRIKDQNGDELTRKLLIQ